MGHEHLIFRATLLVSNTRFVFFFTVFTFSALQFTSAVQTTS